MFRQSVIGSSVENNKDLFGIMLDIEPDKRYEHTENDKYHEHISR